MKNNNSTFSIKTILVNCANSAKHCDEIIRNEDLRFDKKDFFKRIERKLKSVEDDMCFLISPELAAEIRKEISENWETLAVQNINTMVMSMNDAQKQILESVCAHILDGTFSIEEKK